MIRLCLILVFMLAASSALAADIPVIQCPTEPLAVRQLELQERWRIDPYDEEAPLLGVFDQGQIVVHEGRTYMLDKQLCHVLIYDEDGLFLGTIMGEGEGPGEVRNPGALILCSDGRLAVQHGYPTKLEFVDLDGTPHGRWRVESNAWINQLQETPRGWFGIYTETVESEDDGGYTSFFHVALHDNEGRRTTELHAEQRPFDHRDDSVKDEAEEHEPWYTAKVVGDDEVVLAPDRDEYRLEWRDLDGQTTRIVTREFDAHRRSSAELDRLKYTNYSIVGDEVRFKKRKLSAYDPMIRTLEPMPDGSLRVRTSLFEKDLPDGMVCRYEVHDPDGTLRERVEIYDPTGEYDTDFDVVALLNDGSAMVLRNARPAMRASYESRLHPDVRDKLPPLPEEREEVAFTPIKCDLVPIGLTDSDSRSRTNR